MTRAAPAAAPSEGMLRAGSPIAAQRASDEAIERHLPRRFPKPFSKPFARRFPRPFPRPVTAPATSNVIRVTSSNHLSTGAQSATESPTRWADNLSCFEKLSRREGHAAR